MNGELSNLLKEKRFESNMSLREFSAFLGISHAYLSKLEKGIDPRSGKDIIPTIETINKIADGLNIARAEFYELCGYTRDADEPSTESEVIDIRRYFAKTISLFKSGVEFELDGRSLKEKELRMISEALETGFTLALKKLI